MDWTALHRLGRDERRYRNATAAPANSRARRMRNRAYHFQ
jgi:hypothetical protein